MRAYWKTLVAVAAILVVVPQLAAADEVQDQLNQMQERMAQLEDSLKATQDELVSAQGQVEEQQNVIRRSGLDEERSGLSALSAFLNDTEFGGAVAASYNYNFNDPGDSVNGGITTHGTNNSFQVDQVHFSMSNDSTEKSRAGFGFDAIHGATSANGDGPQIMQAYASYLMPVASGLTLTAGRFDSAMGAEVVYVGQNLNITRGLVRALQPVNHNGAKLDLAFNDNLSVSASVSNTGFAGNTSNADTNDAKTWTVGAGWSSDMAGLSVTYMAFDDAVLG
ncbi:MAG: outer membrane beta-barrel protein, partial [Myxococcales bacterium]|nr:outer membrane beta-barrel protein [Myxococcales bacterium]